MTRILRVGTSVDIAVGPYVDRSDGFSAIAIATAGITPGNALRIKKNGQAWVSACSEVWRQEDAGGWFYEVRLTAGDVDTLGHLMWTNYVIGSAMPVWHDFHIVTTAAYNLHFNYPNQIDGDRLCVDTVQFSHVTAVPQPTSAAPFLPSDIIVWNHSSVTSMPGDYTAQQKANVVAWSGVTVQAITTVNPWIGSDMVVASHVTVIPTPTTAAPYLPSDMLLWEHATANALIAGRVDANVGAMQADTITNAALADATEIKANVVAWGAVTVQAITTANLNIPADVVVWEHLTANALIAGRVDANVGAMQADTITNAALADATQIKADVVAWSGVTVQAITTANPYPSIDLVLWAHSSVSAMPGGSPVVSGIVNANVVAWTGVTLEAITTAIPFVKSDVVVWAHSSVSAMPGGSPVVTGIVRTDVVSWTGVTIVDAITTAIPFVKSDVVVWAHSTVSAMPGGSPVVTGIVRADVVSWTGVTVVDAITTALPFVKSDIVVWAHSTVSAMPGGSPVVAGIVRADVVAWTAVTILPAITTALPYVRSNVLAWNESTPVSAMPPGTVTVGSVNVNSWAGTSVAAVVTAGWPQVEVASYAAGESPLQPTVAGRTLDVTTGGEGGVDWANIGTPGSTQNLSATTIGVIGAAGISSGSFAAGAIDSNALAASAVDEILDDALESTITVRQALRIMLAATAGKLSGAATTNVLIRDFLDTKNRIDAIVDANGNRTTVTLDGT
jgi:hypothetical protein